VVELVVKVLVDLAAGTVLDQKAAEDTQAAHPDDLTITWQAGQPNVLWGEPGKPGFLLGPHSQDPFLRPLSLHSQQSHPRLCRYKRTSAYGHRRYPCAFRSHGGDRSGGRGSAPERVLLSAW
jgi:hypothetical protein